MKSVFDPSDKWVMEDEREREREVSVNGSTLCDTARIPNGFCLCYEHKVCGAGISTMYRHAMCQSAHYILIPHFQWSLQSAVLTSSEATKVERLDVEGGRSGAQPSAIHHAMTSHDVHVISKAMAGERVYPHCFQYHMSCLRCFDVMILGFHYSD